MNALLETLLDNLHEGVMLLTPEGVVRYANTLACTHWGVSVGQRVHSDALSRALRALSAGLATTPHAFALETSTHTAMEGRLVRCPGEAELLLLTHPAPDAASTVRSIGELINQHCRTPMQSFLSAAELAVEALRARNPHDTDIQRIVARAVARGKTLADKLSQLVAIAEAAAGHPVAAEERVMVKPLIESAASRAQSLAEASRMRIFTEGLEGDLPPLYGSEVWLSRAVFELIATAVYCGKAGADVLVSVSANNGAVSLSVRVAGSTAHVPGRSQTFTPFYSAPTEEGLYARALGLGLPFARWVFERHGGEIALNDDANGIAEFTARLPAASPSNLPAPDAMAQTRRYAEDLAALMAAGGHDVAIFNK